MCYIFFLDIETAVDWEFATREIYEQWGIDLKAEKSNMQKKLFEAEEMLEKEQEMSALALEKQREEYEQKIKTLEYVYSGRNVRKIMT